jgi:hypothetical protein
LLIMFFDVVCGLMFFHDVLWCLMMFWWCVDDVLMLLYDVLCCLIMFHDVWCFLMIFYDVWWCFDVWWCLMMFDDVWWCFDDVLWHVEQWRVAFCRDDSGSACCVAYVCFVNMSPSWGSHMSICKKMMSFWGSYPQCHSFQGQVLAMFQLGSATFISWTDLLLSSQRLVAQCAFAAAHPNFQLPTVWRFCYCSSYFFVEKNSSMAGRGRDWKCTTKK